MRHDSYARFLKSSLYKAFVMAEMEGKPLLTGDNLSLDSNASDDRKVNMYPVIMLLTFKC